MGVSIIVQRPPADNQGPEISDSLITSVSCAVERGRNEIDANCSNREQVTATCPPAGYVAPGSLVEVADSEQQVYRGKLTAWALTIDRAEDEITATESITIERVANGQD